MFQLVADARLTHADMTEHVAGLFSLQRIRVADPSAVNCLPFDSHLSTSATLVPESCVRPVFDGVLSVTV